MIIEKDRLDQALVSRGLVVSRARARDLVRRGEVMVDGSVVVKPAARVGPHHDLTLAPGAGDYVSRGAIKLRAALDYFGLEPAGRIGLDIGSSTGGFTEVLLARGAIKVYAVDNGVGQLHASLRTDQRVVSLEETDARGLTANEISEPVGALVADVSFISLVKVLPAAMRLVAPGCWLAALIKPQFEAERTWLPKDGVITDADIHAETVAAVANWLAGCEGWRVLGTLASPIKGGDGNSEFLIGAVHD